MLSQQWHNLKALVVLQKMRRKNFEPMYASALTPPSKRHRANRKSHQDRGRWSWLVRPLGCLFVWDRRGGRKNSRRAPSPDKTALMSFEEAGDSDPYIFHSRSADSELAVAPLEGFPYWQSLPNDDPVEPLSRTFDVAEMETTKEKEDSLRQSLQSLLQSNRYRVPMESDYRTTMSVMTDELDTDSHHFSTSTEPPRTAFNTRISVTESSSVTDRSVNTARSSRTGKSRVSLEQFMEKNHHETSSLAARNLGEISANDSVSVNSAYLAVSYDEDYPQLVLQPSLDGTASRMSSTVHSSGTLGACYPHPASGRSVASFDTAKKNISCTPRWLDENIDMVWKQIDACQDEENGEEEDMDEATCDDGATNEDGTTCDDEDGATCDEEDGATYDDDGATDDDDEGTYEESTSSSMTNPNKQRSKNDWVSEAWSFSPETTTKSFTDMIDKGVIQPMLKPICHFVDSTEIPETTASVRHDPLTESGANVRAKV